MDPLLGYARYDCPMRLTVNPRSRIPVEYLRTYALRLIMPGGHTFRVVDLAAFDFAFSVKTILLIRYKFCVNTFCHCINCVCVVCEGAIN